MTNYCNFSTVHHVDRVLTLPRVLYVDQFLVTLDDVLVDPSNSVIFYDACSKYRVCDYAMFTKIPLLEFFDASSNGSTWRFTLPVKCDQGSSEHLIDAGSGDQVIVNEAVIYNAFLSHKFKVIPFKSYANFYSHSFEVNVSPQIPLPTGHQLWALYYNHHTGAPLAPIDCCHRKMYTFEISGTTFTPKLQNNNDNLFCDESVIAIHKNQASNTNQFIDYCSSGLALVPFTCDPSRALFLYTSSGHPHELCGLWGIYRSHPSMPNCGLACCECSYLPGAIQEFRVKPPACLPVDSFEWSQSPQLLFPCTFIWHTDCLTRNDFKVLIDFNKETGDQEVMGSTVSIYFSDMVKILLENYLFGSPDQQNVPLCLEHAQQQFHGTHWFGDDIDDNMKEIMYNISQAIVHHFQEDGRTRQLVLSKIAALGLPGSTVGCEQVMTEGYVMDILPQVNGSVYLLFHVTLKLKCVNAANEVLEEFKIHKLPIIIDLWNQTSN